ncbi:hypothetical protein SPONN_939 [uncultured Candidatus Thioglobus sp.]|nr:hypothetical protein SPONN_939 [uncultured Candidatus Thioglobus sp.]
MALIGDLFGGGTGYFFSFFGIPLAFSVDRNPYFFAVLASQFLFPSGACLFTLFLILSISF